jgi:hypothetical protein
MRGRVADTACTRQRSGRATGRASAHSRTPSTKQEVFVGFSFLNSHPGLKELDER